MSRFSPYLLWLILAIPSIAIFPAFFSDSSRALHISLHPSGEFSARFLIISLMATPLMLLFKGAKWTRWLVKNRRYFGVAAFAYAVLHTLAYMIDEGVNGAIRELSRFYIWTGWLAFLVFLPLAATSFDYMVRKMGTKWKALQRWVYAAAILTLLHWASLHNWHGVGAALVHFGPLGLLTLYRLWYIYLRPRKPSGQ